MELLLELESAGRPRRALERALRERIRAGKLAPGTKLPGTRALAAQLGVARGTVAAAYDQLAAEGFLATRPGAATTVAAVARPAAAPAPPDGRADRRAARSPDLWDTAPRTDLRPGMPDLSAFPRADWHGALRRVLRASPASALGYGDPRGALALRTALATYLARARGVVADPGQIVVCAGFSSALSILAGALRASGHGALAMEDPGLYIHRTVVTAAELRIAPVRVDSDGMDATALGGSGARAALLTPAHQFPLGVTCGPARRAALIGWARETGGYLIEDDYDGEFRFDRQPVGALHALDPARVVYAGTVSKSLAPALRLAWLVPPPSLLDAVVEGQRRQRSLPAVDQLALADLIASGRFDRHLRRMRAAYRKRRDHLASTLAARTPELPVTGISAGLHAVVALPPGGPTERDVHALAAASSVGLGYLGRFWHAGVSPADRQGLVVGYSGPPSHAYPQAVDALAGVLSDALAR